MRIRRNDSMRMIVCSGSSSFRFIACCWCEFSLFLLTKWNLRTDGRENIVEQLEQRQRLESIETVPFL